MSERMDKRKAELNSIMASGKYEAKLTLIYTYLLDDQDYYNNLANARMASDCGIDTENIYFDVMIESIKKYDASRGAEFTTFFINQLKYAYSDARKKAKKVELTDDDQYYDNADNSCSSAENEFLELEDGIECHMDLLYELMRITLATKRSQKKMMTLFYTDDLMTIFSDLGFEKSREYKHEKMIYSSMESDLVDYVYSGKVMCFKDMSTVSRKKLRQLIEYYDAEESLKDVYDEIWGKREREKADGEIEFSLSNNIFIAYLFMKEYEESGRKIVPTPHPQAYVSKYRKVYVERKIDLGKSRGYISF